MRLVPHSLGGRLALLLVLAVVAAQVAAFAMFAHEASRVDRAAARTQVVDRVATLVRLLDTVPADAVPGVIAAYGTPRHRFSIAGDSFVPEGAMGADEAKLARRLDRRVKAGASQARIALVERDAEPDLRPDRLADKPQVLRVSVRLDDGRWLNAEAPLALQAPPWIRMGLIQILASVVAVLAVVAIARRGIVGPMTDLAQAAELAGRGGAVATLPERGPREVRTMIAAFNRMQARSQAFVADRTRMLAAISHDLRTPIASLWLRAEMVEDEALRTAMVRTLATMRRMVEATLAFAHADASDQDRGPFDLVVLFRTLAEDQRVLDRDVVVTGPSELAFHGRATALRRALDNLVENAVRYGGRARIVLEGSESGVRIRIDDDGPGIPADRVEAMFSPFVRLEPSRSAETGGTGLGLAIARSAIRAHGGEIAMANRPEGGLRVTVTLPGGADPATGLTMSGAPVSAP